MPIDSVALIAAARAARERAYAPYSQFAVGAALLTVDGSIIPGCNIENAAYSACICAERAAVAGAIAGGHRQFAALAVIADSPRPVPPCGVCRQVLAEIAPGLIVFLANLAGAVEATTITALLPGAFGPGDLRPQMDTDGHR